MSKPSIACYQCSQTCTDTWHSYTDHQITVYQKQTQQAEVEFDMEIVSLIVQQLPSCWCYLNLGFCIRVHVVDFVTLYFMLYTIPNFNIKDKRAASLKKLIHSSIKKGLKNHGMKTINYGKNYIVQCKAKCIMKLCLIRTCYAQL